MNALDKKAIAAQFSRAAPTYDGAAIVQRLMAERLVAILPEKIDLYASSNGLDADPMLELGCGTGLLAELLMRRYPNALLHAIDLAPGMIEHCRRRFAKNSRMAFEIADAELFHPNFNPPLVAANCTFQWLADPETALARIRTWIAPKGRLALGVLLDGTLLELASSYRAASGRDIPALDLWDESQWRSALARNGWRALDSSRAESLIVDYRDPLEVVRGLKEIGAALSRRNGDKPLSATELRRLAADYRVRFGDPQSDRIPATYRAFLIIAEGL